MQENENWWKEAVIYQIYPRSFFDKNHDGIGDLTGIISKLDYLAWLGVDALWLSPVFPSPDVDFGYDVSDYRSIDPKFGTLQDFDTLVEEAHRRNIRIILDMVMNHTSDQHPWFLESRSSRNNACRDWYLWKDPVQHGNPPNNWASITGGSGWEWDEKTGQYYFHMFTREQPDLNWRNPDVRREMMDICRFWCERGVHGFRLDVFNAYFKDAGFRNNPRQIGLRLFEQQKHLYDINQPEMIPLLKEFRSILNSFPGRYAVGETFLDSRNVIDKYCGDDLLHAAFDFSLLKSAWKPGSLKKAMQSHSALLGNKIWPTQVLNNHDTPRSATRYHAGDNDEHLKQAAALLLTLRGTACMYYGEEIGMRDITLKRGEVLDPVGKKYWPLHKGRDGCRAPMQWDALSNGGFSPVKPWLPVNSDYTKRNVEQQSSDAESLLLFYKALILLRRNHPALRLGEYFPVETDRNSVLAFLRKTADETILVAINFGTLPADLRVRVEECSSGWTVLLSSLETKTAYIPENEEISLQPQEVVILLKGNEPAFEI